MGKDRDRPTNLELRQAASWKEDFRQLVEAIGSGAVTFEAVALEAVLSFVHMSEEKFEAGLSPLVWVAQKDGTDLLKWFEPERLVKSASTGRNGSFSDRPSSPQSPSDATRSRQGR